jgi:DNA-binding transcriptional regulator YhcF (GntR family)
LFNETPRYAQDPFLIILLGPFCNGVMVLFAVRFLWSNSSIVLQLDGTGPRYQQIYRAFRAEILTGTLAPGERVPSTRALPDLLEISRNTAVSAYDQLLAEGYLKTRLGAAGTVVAPILPPNSPYANSARSRDGKPDILRRARVQLATGGEKVLRAQRGR